MKEISEDLPLRLWSVRSKLFRMKITEKLESSFLFVAAIALIAASAYSQRVDPARVKINNLVGLDSTYAAVLKVLGKPRKETRPVKEECTGGHEKTVDFDGLSFYFMDGANPGKKGYRVMSFDVTTPRVNVSGVKLGDDEATVRRRFGKPKSVDTDKATGETTWVYEIGEQQGPGQTSVAFKKGRVTAISSAYQVC